MDLASDPQRRTAGCREGCRVVSSTQPPLKTFNYARDILAFVAYAQLFGRGDLPFFVACFGLVCSVAWALQNRGSKYWQEAWEAKVESVEKTVLGVELFANREPRQ